MAHIDTAPASPIPDPHNRIRTRSATQDLLLFTTMSALDGTVLLLAAGGTLSTWTGALAAGLTVCAGTGAWLSAKAAFRNGMDRAGWLRLGRVAAIASALTLAAGAAGGLLGNVPLHVLPKAAGIALLLVALEVGVRPLPRPAGIPAPLFVLAVALPWEVLHHWTP